MAQKRATVLPGSMLIMDASSNLHHVSVFILVTCSQTLVFFWPLCHIAGSASAVCVLKQTDAVTNIQPLFNSLRCASVTANMDVLTRVTVDYETLPGWCCSTEAARSFEELPSQAQKYIHFIEDFLQVPGVLTRRCSESATFFSLYSPPLLPAGVHPFPILTLSFQLSGSALASPGRA